ncbi:MAG: hypothetical protein ABEJ92_04935 [Halobacteriales archaeon]
MNSSRCFSLVALLLLLVVTVGAVGAVSVDRADMPDEGRVGADLTGTVVLTELFQNPSFEQWTLRGATELENVTWTVSVVDQAGNQLAQPSYDNQTFQHPVSIESGVATIRVTVTGTVPPIANYTYEPAESFRVARLTLARQGGTSEPIASYDAHHYTQASREARRAIDDARAAIDAAGGHQGAERTLESAISAYENANFENAVRLAEQARETAEQAQATQQRNRLILLAVGVLVVVAIVVAAVVYWRRTRTHSRL